MLFWAQFIWPNLKPTGNGKLIRVEMESVIHSACDEICLNLLSYEIVMIDWLFISRTYHIIRSMAAKSLFSLS